VDTERIVISGSGEKEGRFMKSGWRQHIFALAIAIAMGSVKAQTQSRARAGRNITQALLRCISAPTVREEETSTAESASVDEAPLYWFCGHLRVYRSEKIACIALRVLRLLHRLQVIFAHISESAFSKTEM
jgi:hypothetical protein